jgi:hypothetical protein
MPATEKTTRVQEARDNLLEEFKSKQNFQDILDAFTGEVQQVEAMLFELVNERFLDTAVGAQLDGLGQIIGILRGGLDDDAYRTRLRAQIRILISSGTIEDMLAILALILPGGTGLVLTEDLPGTPAVFQVDVVDAIDGALGQQASRVLQTSKAAGVRAILSWFLSETNTFQFTVSGAVDSDALKGFGDLAFPNAGGRFANADDDGAT